MTARICKRCGAKLSRFTARPVCHPCRAGKGRMYAAPDPNARRSPEIPTAPETDRRRH